MSGKENTKDCPFVINIMDIDYCILKNLKSVECSECSFISNTDEFVNFVKFVNEGQPDWRQSMIARLQSAYYRHKDQFVEMVSKHLSEEELRDFLYSLDKNVKTFPENNT